MNEINKGDFVRVKEKYAFDISSQYHYGEVVDTDCINGELEINLKSDLRYTHDSIIWLKMDLFEKIR